MAKRNDYITGREDGLLMALEIVKNEGVEALEKEIEFRNITGIRTALAKKDINRATIKIKEQTVDTVTILSVATLQLCIWKRDAHRRLQSWILCM